MADNFEEIERTISELEEKIEQVEKRTREQGIDRTGEIDKLRSEVRRLLSELYSNLSRWDKTRIARHPKRPYTLDFIRLMFQDFVDLHGDRISADDGAMIGGIARLGDQWVTIVGQQKGRDAQERFRRNFGSARPEGYRKA